MNTQAQQVQKNNTNLVKLYNSQGFEIEIVQDSDDLKTWAVMYIRKPQSKRLVGAHLFQDGKMVSNLTNNK